MMVLVHGKAQESATSPGYMLRQEALFNKKALTSLNRRNLLNAHFSLRIVDIGENNFLTFFLLCFVLFCFCTILC